MRSVNSMLVLGLHLFLGAQLVSEQAALATEERVLAPGAEIEGWLDEEEEQTFQLELPPDRIWRLRLDEGTLDLVLTVDRVIGEPTGGVGIDTPIGRSGSERFVFIDAEPGPYRVEVRARSGASGAGSYRLRVDELPTDRPEDQLLIDAEVAMMHAAEFNYHGTANALADGVEAYERAVPLWRRLNQPTSEAEALHGLGELHRRRGNAREAVEVLGEALGLSRQLGGESRQASILNSLGFSHWMLGEVEMSQQYLELALELWRKIEDRNGEAHSLNLFCLTWHQQGDLDQAVACYQQALDLFRREGNRAGEAPLLNNIGSIYSAQGEPERAYEYFERAIRLYEELGLSKVDPLTNLAVLARRTGEIQRALRLYEEVLGIHLEFGDRRSEARALNNLGRAYVSLGEPKRALYYFEKALPLRREYQDRRGEAVTLNNLGQVYRRLGRLDESLESHRQALEIAEAAQVHQSAVVAMIELGRGHAAIGETTSALELFERVLATLEGTGDRVREADALTSQGLTFLQAGNVERAAVSLRRARDGSQLAGYKEGEVQALTALATLNYEQGHLEAARDQIGAALQIIETLRTRLNSPDLRASFLSTKRGAYELAIDIAMALHQVRPEAQHDHRGLQISERARARILLDMLQEAEADLLRRADSELRERHHQLERRLNSKADQRLRLDTAAESEKSRQLEADILALVGDLENVEADIRQQVPDFGSLTLPPVLGVDDYARLLDPRTVLLEYALTSRGGYLWWISEREVTSFRLDGTREEIESLALDAYRHLTRLDLRPDPNQAQTLRRLSRILIGPVADRLAGQRLVIVADGALNYVPFTALPRVSSATASGDSPVFPGGPLLLDHEIVHLPSASALTLQRQDGSDVPASRDRIAILADPVFDSGDVRVLRTSSTGSGQSMGRSRERGGLERLPATRREAESIAMLARPARKGHAEVLTALDFHANRSMVLSGKLSEYRIIHFATHGVLDSETPRLSGLALSQVDADGRAQEGFLRLHDIYRLDLQAELAVLSGCQTALGKEIRGEGLIGLTRGFMYAGVPRVIASLWRVEDDATTELMIRLYRGIWEDQLSPSAALRAAQKSIYQESRWRDPYYWAAFVLQGEWR